MKEPKKLTRNVKHQDVFVARCIVGSLVFVSWLAVVVTMEEQHKNYKETKSLHQFV